MKRRYIDLAVEIAIKEVYLRGFNNLNDRIVFHLKNLAYYEEFKRIHRF